MPGRVGAGSGAAQQHRGARIQPARREHPARRDEPEVLVGRVNSTRAGASRRRGLGGEVMLAGHDAPPDDAQQLSPSR